MIAATDAAKDAVAAVQGLPRGDLVNGLVVMLDVPPWKPPPGRRAEVT
ncbi:hypothetical protein [Spirillospora sp. CA-128828]